MTILTVLQFPDPKLRLAAKPIEIFDASTAKLCADMFETMYAHDGIGLAATQVGVQARILVMDLSDDKSARLCMINPKIIHAEGDITWQEGCLSFPGIYGKVTRSMNISVEYCDINGNPHTIHATDLTAVCIQHEIDHLNGITFYDHLSPLKQKMIDKKLAKMRDPVS